jgi:hypothetical protein
MLAKSLEPHTESERGLALRAFDAGRFNTTADCLTAASAAHIALSSCSR